jgi:hypothetical protein
MPIVLFSMAKEKYDEIGHYHGFTIEPDLPGESWICKDVKGQQSIPLRNGELKPELELGHASFVLPYITGLPFTELVKILDDEEHNLADYRLGIRRLIKEIQEGSTDCDEVLNDVVRPAVSKVEKRFRSIVCMSRVKIAGAVVGTSALTLASLTSAGIMASLSALFGVGGLGLLTKEVTDHLKAKEELSNLPHYFLWRLSKANTKKASGLGSRYM